MKPQSIPFFSCILSNICYNLSVGQIVRTGRRNEMVLTDEQVENIRIGIEKKLLEKDIEAPNLREVNPVFRQEAILTFTSDDIAGVTLGNFKHIIRSYSVFLRVWLRPTANTFIASIHFYWKHKGRGSNGHELCFRLQGHMNGKEIIEFQAG